MLVADKRKFAFSYSVPSVTTDKQAFLSGESIATNNEMEYPLQTFWLACICTLITVRAAVVTRIPGKGLCGKTLVCNHYCQMENGREAYATVVEIVLVHNGTKQHKD